MSKRHNHTIRKRIAIDIAGFGLILLSPLLAPLPGPGGIPVFLAGIGILSLNYEWAERLLKDFEKRRLEFVEKYLVGNKKVAWTIDLLCLFIIGLAIFIYLEIDSTILGLMTLGVGSFSLFIMASNQRRLDRLLAWTKKRFKK